MSAALSEHLRQMADLKKKNGPRESPGRPKSGTAAGSLREGLKSPYPMLRGAAEQTIRAALGEPSWAAVARRLGIPTRSFEDLRRDFPEIDGWRKKDH